MKKTQENRKRLRKGQKQQKHRSALRALKNSLLAHAIVYSVTYFTHHRKSSFDSPEHVKPVDLS